MAKAAQRLPGSMTKLSLRGLSVPGTVGGGTENAQDGAPAHEEVTRQGPTNKQPAHNVMSVTIRGHGKQKALWAHR